MNTVCGTTGWYEQLPQIRESSGWETALVFGPNFSVGVNLFLEIVAQLRRLWRNIRNMKRGAGRSITRRRKMRLRER